MPVVLPLVPVMAALAALVLIYGAAYVGKFVAHLVPESIGFGAGPGVPLRSLIEGLIDDVVGLATGLFDAYIRPIVGFILRPVLALINWLTSIGLFAVSAASQLYWLTTSALPEVLDVAKFYAAALYHRALAYAARLYHRATAYALSLVRAARAYALSLVRAAVSELDKAVRAARVYAHDLFRAEAAARAAAVAAAEHYAHTLVTATAADLGKAIHTLEAEITGAAGVTLSQVSALVDTGVKQAEDFANTAAAAAVGVLSTDIPAAITSLTTGVIDDIDTLEGVLGQDLPDIGDLLRSIPRDVPLDLIGTLGLSFALERVMARYLRECGIPNCRNLGALGHFLQDLLGAASLAGLLAMLSEMIHDPEGAAQSARDELGGLVSEAQDLVSSLLGV